LVAIKEVVVLAISVTAEANVLEVDDCHLVIEPILPLNVSVVEFIPVQTVAPPAIVPPTDAGETVTVAEALFAAAQAPLVITAL